MATLCRVGTANLVSYIKKDPANFKGPFGYKGQFMTIPKICQGFDIPLKKNIKKYHVYYR